MKYIGHILLRLFFCSIVMGIIIFCYFTRFILYPLWELKWWNSEEASDKSSIKMSEELIYTVAQYIKREGLWKFMTEGYLK